MALYRFGTFIIKMAKERQVKSPMAGGTVTVPERLTVRFSSSKTWLED
jgi:nucleoid DNA-binding protein